MKFKEDLRELNDVQEISINFKPKKRKTQIKIGSSSCAEDVFRIFFEDEISYRENFMIMILTNSNHVVCNMATSVLLMKVSAIIPQ